jgi:DNA-binding NarL/FixJ family response regulator
MKVLIVDPHPVCREGLSKIIRAKVADCEFIYQEDCERLQSTIAKLRPELVVIDGDLVARARADMPMVVELSRPHPVIVMNPQADAVAARWAHHIGVRGFIPKTYSSELVDAAIGIVVAGGRYLPSHIPLDADAAHPWGHSKLTARQREVLDRLAVGLSNQDIAHELGITVGTVKLHLHNAFSAIGVKNRTQAAMWVRRHLRRARE